MSENVKFGGVSDVNLGDYPIFKHFKDDEIATKVNSTFRTGEFTIYNALKIGVIGATGYGVWVYVLPPILAAVGQVLAIASTVVLSVGFVLMSPVIFKGLKMMTRAAHKALINHDPFYQLELERVKMVENLSTFRIAMGKIIGLSRDMEINAVEQEKEARLLEVSILSAQRKGMKYKEEMDEMIKVSGEIAKEDDKYVALATKFQKILAESNRNTTRLSQAKDLVQKYGSRGNIMKKMGQNLTFAESAMEIKIGDFDATVDMLKIDYEFGRKSNEASSAAAKILGKKKTWEVTYTMDVIAATMSADIAITAGNLKDIESITKNFNFDSDEMFMQLNAVADKIKVNDIKDAIPEAKKYKSLDYDLTSDDKLKGGGFTDLF